MSQPLVYIAYANAIPQQPLHHLKREAEAIRELLAASSGPHLEVRIRESATIATLLKDLRSKELRSRVCIFHYAGHANGEGLFLQGDAPNATGMANIAGLADFLQKLGHLQLVFLNGCMTGGQAKALYKVGVPSAITTVESIADDAAMALAVAFYERLAAGDTIKAAFDDAFSAVKTRAAESLRGLRYAGQIASPWERLGDPDWRLADAVKSEYQRIAIADELNTSCPYPGPRRFDVSEGGENGIFFGRASEVAELDERVRNYPVTIVYGDSGNGKSSFVRAGFIEKWRRDQGADSKVIAFEPSTAPLTEYYSSISHQLGLGAHKLDQLSQSTDRHCIRDAFEQLGREDSWLVLIDQFEQLFTRTEDAEARENLIAAIVDANNFNHGKLRIILTMRVDVVGQLNNELAAIQNRAGFLLVPLKGRSLRDAIEGPAARHGVRCETGLIEELAGAVEGRPGGLALLQFTLRSLWAAEGDFENRVLRLETYDTFGGVSGSLKEWIEGFKQENSAVDDDVLRAVLLQLVDVKSDLAGAPAFSRAVPKSQFTGAQLEAVDRLVDAKLLASRKSGTDGGVNVEIGHEALIDAWPGLTKWLNELRGVIPLDRRITRLAERWKGLCDAKGLVLANRVYAAKDDFLKGSELDDALIARDRGDLDRLDAGCEAEQVRANQEFLSASKKHREHVKKEKERSDKTRNLARQATGGLIAVATFFALLSWFNYEDKQRADEAVRHASVIQAARFVERGQPNDALAHYARVLRSDPNDEAALVGVLQLLDHFIVGPIPLAYLEESVPHKISKDASFLITTGFPSLTKETLFQVWDAKKGEPIGEPISAVIAGFTMDGTRIYAVKEDGTRSVLDPKTLKQTGPTLRHDRATQWISGPGGTRVFSVADDLSAKLWDAQTGDVVSEFADVSPENGHVTFSRDERRIAAQDILGSLIILNAASGGSIETHSSGRDPAGVAFNRDGTRLLVRTKVLNRPVFISQLVDSETGDSIGEPISCVNERVQFTPDGTRVVRNSGSSTGLFDSQDDGNTSVDFASPTDRFYSNFFLSLDGERSINTPLGEGCQLWDAKTGRQIGMACPPSVNLDFSPDGSKFVTAKENNISLATLSDNKIIANVRFGSPVRKVIFSPDGANVIVLLDNQLWRAKATGPKPDLELLLDTVEERPAFAMQVAFSADGSRLIARASDGIHVWETAAYRPVFAPINAFTTRDPFAPESVDAMLQAVTNQSRGGSRLLSLSPHRWEVAIWAVDRTPRIPITFPGERGALSSDGMRLTTALDDTGQVWNVRSGHRRGAKFQHQHTIDGIKFSRDNSSVLTFADDNQARLWDAGSGIALEGATPMDHVGSDPIGGFSHDGTRVFTTDYPFVHVWDAKTGQAIGDPIEVEGPDDKAGFFKLAISPDNSRLAVVTQGSPVANLYDTNTRKLIQRLEQHTKPIRQVVFSPFGDGLMTASEDKSLCRWNPASGELEVHLKGLKADVNSLSVNSDGTIVAAACADGVTHLLDAMTFEGIAAPLDPLLVRGTSWTPGVDECSFSPSGSVIATSAGGRVLLWDIRTSQVVGKPLMSEMSDTTTGYSPELAIAFSSNGTMLMTQTNLWSKPDVRLWPISLDLKPFQATQLARLAESVAGRRVNDDSLLETLESVDLVGLRKRYASVLSHAPVDDWERFVHWFLRLPEDPLQQPVTLGTEMTLIDYLDHLADTSTESSYAELLRLVPHSDPRVLGAVVDRLIELVDEDEDAPDWAIDLAHRTLLRLDPSDPRHETIANLRDQCIKRKLASGSETDVRDAIRLNWQKENPEFDTLIDRLLELGQEDKWALELARQMLTLNDPADPRLEKLEERLQEFIQA